VGLITLYHSPQSRSLDSLYMTGVSINNVNDDMHLYLHMVGHLIDIILLEPYSKFYLLKRYFFLKKDVFCVYE
jgi:hypothetical protein